MQYILLILIILTFGIMMLAGSSPLFDVLAIMAALGAFIIFIVPTASIGENVIRNRDDIKVILCCVPLLIAGVYQTMNAVFGYTRIMMYEAHPGSLYYIFLHPIQNFIDIVIQPTTQHIFYMGFPYNQLPQFLAYIIILPISLFIYMLPSIDYKIEKMTREMKLIALSPIVLVLFIVIVHTVKLKLGLIDKLMIQFFWLEIVQDINKIGVFILMPVLSFLYTKHYKKTKKYMK